MLPLRPAMGKNGAILVSCGEWLICILDVLMNIVHTHNYIAPQV